MLFRRRDIPSVLLLSLLILLIILTLSQILVVHNGRLGGNSRHKMRKLQAELRELDINLHSVMMHRVPSIELNRRLLQNQINSNKFLRILKEASKIRQIGVNESIHNGEPSISNSNNRLSGDNFYETVAHIGLTVNETGHHEKVLSSQRQNHYSQRNRLEKNYNKLSTILKAPHERLKEAAREATTVNNEFVIQNDTSVSLVNDAQSKLSGRNSQRRISSSRSVGSSLAAGTKSNLTPPLIVKDTRGSQGSVLHHQKQLNQSVVNSQSKARSHRYKKLPVQYCPSIPPNLSEY